MLVINSNFLGHLGDQIIGLLCLSSAVGRLMNLHTLNIHRKHAVGLLMAILFSTILVVKADSVLQAVGLERAPVVPVRQPDAPPCLTQTAPAEPGPLGQPDAPPCLTQTAPAEPGPLEQPDAPPCLTQTAPGPLGQPDETPAPSLTAVRTLTEQRQLFCLFGFDKATFKGAIL